jgi:hypothetical protein
MHQGFGRPALFGAAGSQRCSTGPVDPITIAAGCTGSEVGPMRVLPVVLLVLWAWSAALVGDAAAQEDTATLWAALRAGG